MIDLGRLTMSDFDRIVADLETETEPLSLEKRKIHYERLMYYEPADLKQAVNILIDTHHFHAFPTVADFKAALDMIQKKSSSASVEELAERNPCPKCHNGFMEARVIWLGLIYEALVYCDCDLGKWRRKQWTRADGRFGRRKTEAATVFQVRPRDHEGWSNVIPENIVLASLGPRPGERVRAGIPGAAPEVAPAIDAPDEEPPF